MRNQPPADPWEDPDELTLRQLWAQHLDARREASRRMQEVYLNYLRSTHGFSYRPKPVWVGGYTGTQPHTEVAGIVHQAEYYIDPRWGTSDLEAIASKYVPTGPRGGHWGYDYYTGATYVCHANSDAVRIPGRRVSYRRPQGLRPGVPDPCAGG